MSRSVRVAVSMVCVALAGCALPGRARARRDAAAAAAEAAAAEDLRRGCYACLLDARTTLAPHLGTRPVARREAFEAELLIVLREKELGLDAAEALAQARRLAGLLPTSVDAVAYVDAVDRVPFAAGSRRRDFDMTFRQEHRVTPEALTALVSKIRSGPLDAIVDDYVALSLACDGSRMCSDEVDRVLPASAGVPLLEYGLGTTSAARRALLDAALAQEPRFTEALLFRGRYRLAGTPHPAPGPGAGVVISTTSEDLDAAERDLRQARQTFGESPVVAMTLAGLLRTSHDWEGALALYGRTLELVPDQEDALLGRVLALTNLRRHAAAAEAATRLIDLGTWYVGEARYWRAWNRLALEDIPGAYADSRMAIQLWANTDVYTLAGIVDLKRHENAAAEQHLDQAIALDGANCSARRYLGFAETALSHSAEAAAAFVSAFTCFQAATADLRAAPISPDTASAHAERRQAIEQSVIEEGEAALNAALAYARENAVADARRFAAIAQQYAGVRDRAGQLLADLSRSSGG